MKTILAALDCSGTARPVLESARGLAESLGATVDAVHVDGEEPGGPAESDGATRATDAAGLVLRRISGPIVDSLLDAVAAPEVVMGVIGARRAAGGTRPAGHVAKAVLERTSKPVVAVPPEAYGPSPRPFRRIVVPLDGTEPTSLAVAEAIDALAGPGTELVVVHVFGPRTAPPLLNHNGRDLVIWGDEFLRRHVPGREATLEWRSGDAGDHVLDVTAESGADLVVVSWAQSFAGHGELIRALLSRSQVPVLLVPAGVRREFPATRAVVDLTAVDPSDRSLDIGHESFV